MLILASASPRRHELLDLARVPHRVQPASIDETRRSGEGPIEYVRRLAREKALAIKAGDNDVVLGADTIVAVGEEVLSKPETEAHAIAMLRLLSGRIHRVCTGIVLARKDSLISDVSETIVHFYPIADKDIEAYVASGEPMDKAGAYAIQGFASRFVRQIEGCYHNVVGLPVSLVCKHLAEIGEL